MNQALTFILKLQDMLTPGMRQAAQISNTSANQIASQFEKIGGSGKRMNASINELRVRLDAINKVRFSTTVEKEFQIATKAAQKLEAQLEKLEGKGQSMGKGGGMLGSIVGGNLITSLIGKAGDALMGAAGSVISNTFQRQKDKVGLTTFLGKSGAEEAYNNIQQDAAITSFDTASLLSVNRALISSGLNAKDARRDAMNLANAISAVGGGNDELQRMAANMQQIKTVGKASAMDIKQFAMTGINIYEMLAKATGKSIDDVKEMDVGYDLLSKSLQQAAEAGGMYAGALAAQGETMGAKWATFTDKLSIKAADIGDKLKPVFDFVLDGIVSLSEKFDEWLPALQPVFDMLNSIPAVMADILSPTGSWSEYLNVGRQMLNSLWVTVKSLAMNIWNITKGIIEWVKKSELMKDIAWAIGKLFDGVMWVIRKIGDALQLYWEKFLKPMWDKIEWAYKAIKGLFTGNTKATVEVVGKPALDAGKPAGVTDPLKALNAGRDSKIGAADLAAAGGALKEGKAKADGINHGGQRSIVINITKVMDKVEQHILNGGQQAADEFASAVREALRRELYNLNGIAS
jgi:tape measure domain-containing protein